MVLEGPCTRDTPCVCGRERGATGAFGRGVAATPLLHTQNCGMSRDRGVATPWSATGGGGVASAPLSRRASAGAQGELLVLRKNSRKDLLGGRCGSRRGETQDRGDAGCKHGHVWPAWSAGEEHIELELSGQHFLIDRPRTPKQLK